MTLLKEEQSQRENSEIIAQSRSFGKAGIGKTVLLEESEKPDVIYVKGTKNIGNLLENTIKEHKVIIWDRDPQDEPDMLDAAFARSRARAMRSRAMRSRAMHPLWQLESFKENSSNPRFNVAHNAEDLVEHVLKKDGSEISATDESSKDKLKL
jgi:hypothetical protein